MAPKEKAINLVEKFISHTKVHSGDLGLQDYYTAAIDCALIAVDEVLKSIDWDYYEGSSQTEHNWWKEVKQEIEKL